VKKGFEGDIAEVYVRKKEIEGIKVDIKITMLGSEGAGKSTLVGVLISGKIDDGKGSARTNVFRHKHEVMDGRTSSIS
jgi:elongation factor 1-alpha